MAVTYLARLHRIWLRLPHLHRRGLMVLALMIAALAVWPTERSGAEAAIFLPPELSHLEAYPGYQSGGSGENGNERSETAQSTRQQLMLGMERAAEAAPTNIEHYDIQSGDTLSTIFDRLELGQTVMYQILSADESLLALDVMRPGQRLTFTKDPETDRLLEMELFIHEGNRVVYRRGDDSGFEYEEKIIEGDWPTRVWSGEIHGSFYMSARRMGLTDREIADITRLFDEQFDFSRDIRAGDGFEIVRAQQMVNGRPTGQTRLEAIRFHRYNRSNTAYLFEDGSYYDDNGESLARAFMRYPMSNRMRISSAFNPARRHPVTGRVSPHNGTDFAMRTGTPVLSTGDGVVTRVENHPYAGKYIEIQHGSRYATRYLHLDQILVRNGQSISRGDRIGLSGATGRVTGPHLHFELHVNGRPVNPMTADIPMAESVPEERLEDFFELVDGLVATIESADTDASVAQAE